MRPPVLPSASMTLLFAVADVAIYWITAAVAQLRLQHSYSKFAADKRSSDHPPRPQDSAGHDGTSAVTVRAAAVTENVPSVGHTRRTVRPARQYVVRNSGVVRSHRTTTFSFLPPPGDPDGSFTRWQGAERNEGSSQSVLCRPTRRGDPGGCDRRERRCEASVATVGHLGPPRPVPCAGGGPADASHRNFTSIHTDSTATEEMT
jgi:hypothetical protein